MLPMMGMAKQDNLRWVIANSKLGIIYCGELHYTLCYSKCARWVQNKCLGKFRTQRKMLEMY